MTDKQDSIEAGERWKQCSVGSCQRHGKCMYLKHPRCPDAPTPTSGGGHD